MGKPANPGSPRWKTAVKTRICVYGKKLTYRVNIDPSLSGSSAQRFNSGWNVLDIHHNNRPIG